jgi:hypothetical protein
MVESLQEMLEMIPITQHYSLFPELLVQACSLYTHELKNKPAVNIPKFTGHKPQSWSGCDGKEKNHCLCNEMNPSCPANSLTDRAVLAHSA